MNDQKQLIITRSENGLYNAEHDGFVSEMLDKGELLAVVATFAFSPDARMPYSKKKEAAS
jgi:hypothetical protein